MKEWVFVRTATKAPAIRTNRTSPFETFGDVVDPNDGTGFGPGEDFMFIPVVRDIEPSIDPVLEQLSPYETTGDVGGVYEGKYIAPDWVVGWDILPQDLSASKEVQLENLNNAHSLAIETGYLVGQYEFPFTESFFGRLATRLYWMENAIEKGTIPASREITFSDKNGKEVQVTAAQLQSHFAAYGNEFMTISEKEVAARSAIAAATTIQEVDAVSWSF